MKQRSIRSGLVRFAAILTTLVAQVSFADEYSSGWGPSVGSTIPMLAANDQAGQSQTLASLAGEQGLLLFLNRSADW